MNRCKTDKSQSSFQLGNKLDPEHFEPMCDALVYEPMAFQPAIDDGATHVIVLRTRPDGTDVTGKSSIFERLIFRRFFLRKNKLRNMYNYMRRHGHKKKYAEDVIKLNDASKDQRDYRDTSKPHILTIAVPPGSPEVARLETRRPAIFDGVRRGFARAFDALVEDPSQRGKGEDTSKKYFPEQIMDYDPLEIDSKTESAFSQHLKSIGDDPATWKESAVEDSDRVKVAW